MAELEADGYRPFSLPAFGSMPDAQSAAINEICDLWYVAEIEFIRRLMRRVATTWDPDSARHAAAITAVAYFQAVRNGNGIARYVRLHVEGRQPIREPKALFIRTIELHRAAASRGERLASRIRRTESSTAFDEHNDPSTVPARLDTAHQREPSATGRGESALDVRRELVSMLASGPVSAEQVRRKLEDLERHCSEPVVRHRVLDALTDRQRLVFVLRVDPLTPLDSTALDYEQIADLSAILGWPTTLSALRQSLRTALARLRTDHTALRDELRHG